MPVIEGQHDGRRILIPVLVLAPSAGIGLRTQGGTALLDTGSTTSGIRRSVAHALGFVGRGKRPLGSAGGEIQAERYIFSLGLETSTASAPSIPFIFDAVSGFELKDSFSFEALIGMDILCRCEFQMFKNGGFRLSFRREGG